MSTSGIEFKDEDIKFVYLNSGTYKIDGEIINVPYSYKAEMVGVKDFSDIRIVNTTTYIQKYTNGLEDKTVDNYKKEELNLLSHRLRYEDYCEEWDSLENEFNYKKFKQVWQPVKATIQTISDPIEVAVQKINYETETKFITSCFVNGTDKDATLFLYDRPSAVLNIVTECFNELGMKFETGKSYGATENKKVWSNSEHSCIRYVVAFGTYIFGDNWDIRHCPKGKYEDLLKQYKSDKKSLRNLIITKYNKHFGKIDQGVFDFDSLLNKLRTSLGYINNIDPKAKTYDAKRSAINKLNEAISLIESSYSVNVTE